MKHLLLLCTAVFTSLPGYFAQSNNCSTGTQVCNNTSFTGNSSGPGTQELNASNQGCLGIEHQSSWYYFQPVTSGTIGLTIQTSVDYDFAIWSGSCGSLGAPLRCSYSSITGNTGLTSSYYGQTSSFGCGFLGLFACYGNVNVTDVSEGTGGDGWVMPLNVVAGQTYIMLIDNFTANSTPFTLSWTFTNGATLNCTPIVLPVELAAFIANYDAARNANILSWQTASERSNDYFTVEQSTDGASWMAVNQLDGAGDSYAPLNYAYEDKSFTPGKINYYRLSQTDYNGARETFDVVSVDNRAAEKQVVKVVNLMGQEVLPDTPGIVILLYEDGSMKRVYQ